MNRIKVLYLIDSLEMGGAERSLVTIACRLRKVDPVFVHVYEGDFLKQELLDCGIPVFSLGITEKYGYAKAVKKLEKLVHELQPDLIHATLVRSNFISRKLKKNHNLPLINSFTSNSYVPSRFRNLTWFRKLKLRWVQFQDKRSSKCVDLFLSNSLEIKKNNIKCLGIEPERIQVIPRGRDSRLFRLDSDQKEELKRTLQLDNKKVILNVGRLIKSKGQLDLIRAFERVNKAVPNAVLLIAGEGDFRETLEKEIQQRGLERHIRLLGKRNDVAGLLGVADLFVFSSYLEGLPGSLIEAMMARTPIICTDIPENKECVPDKGAWFFSPGDVEKMANFMEQGLRSNEFLQKGTQLNFKYALENFELEQVTSQYEQTYLNLLNSSR